MKYELYTVKNLMSRIMHNIAKSYIININSYGVIDKLENFIINEEIEEATKFLNDNNRKIEDSINKSKSNILRYNTLLSSLYNCYGIIERHKGNYEESKMMFARSFMYHSIRSLIGVFLSSVSEDEYNDFVKDSAPFKNINKDYIFKWFDSKGINICILHLLIKQIIETYSSMDKKSLYYSNKIMIKGVYSLIEDKLHVEFKFFIYDSNTKDDLKESIARTIKALKKYQLSAFESIDKISHDNICNEIVEMIEDKSIILQDTKGKRAINNIAHRIMDLCQDAVEFKRKGLLNDSVNTYIKAIRLSPNNGGIYYNLGKALYLLDKKEEAIRSYVLAHKYQNRYAEGLMLIHLGHALIDGVNYKRHRHRIEIERYHDGIKGELSNSMKNKKDMIYDMDCMIAAVRYIEKLKEEGEYYQ